MVEISRHQSYIPDITDFAHLDKVPVDKLDACPWEAIEADSYWCLSALLDGIQANYTFSQPGIQSSLNKY